MASRQPPLWWIKKLLGFYWRVFTFAVKATWTFVKRHLALSLALGLLGVVVAVVVVVDGTRRASEASQTDIMDAIAVAVGPLVIFATLVFFAFLVWAPFRLFLEVNEQLPGLQQVIASYQQADFDVHLRDEPQVGQRDMGMLPVDVVVTNRGKTAEFEAQVLSIEGMVAPPTTPFSVRWETSEDKRCSITRGHSESLHVATVYGSSVVNRSDGPIDFLRPGGVHEYGITLERDGPETITEARVEALLEVTSLDPPVSKRWSLFISWEVEEEMFRARAELGALRTDADPQTGTTRHF